MSFDQWSPSFLKHMICKATGQSEPVANMRTSISNQITDRRNLKRRVGMPRNVSNEWGKRYFQIDVTYLDIIFLLSKQYHLLLLLLADTLTSLVNCSLPLRRDVPLTDVFLFLFLQKILPGFHNMFCTCFFMRYLVQHSWSKTGTIYHQRHSTGG